MFSAIDASAADQRITVGLHDNAPLIFTDSDNQIKGIAVDILTHIARKEGWAIQYLPGSYAQCTRRLEAGTIDLLPGMAMSAQLEDRFDFGEETIVANWGKLYISSDSTFSDILDFHDKDVAVVEADIYFQFFETILEKFEIRPRFVLVDSYKKVLSMVHEKSVCPPASFPGFTALTMRTGSRFAKARSVSDRQNCASPWPKAVTHPLSPLWTAI
jgi:sigma-B regulation protein RsbU (phosphoserine phosphatase)